MEKTLIYHLSESFPYDTPAVLILPAATCRNTPRLSQISSSLIARGTTPLAFRTCSERPRTSPGRCVSQRRPPRLFHLRHDLRVHLLQCGSQLPKRGAHVPIHGRSKALKTKINNNACLTDHAANGKETVETATGPVANISSLAAYAHILVSKTVKRA